MPYNKYIGLIGLKSLILYPSPLKKGRGIYNRGEWFGGVKLGKSIPLAFFL